MSAQGELFASAGRSRWRLPGEACLELVPDFLPRRHHHGLFERLQEGLRWEQSTVRIAGRWIPIPRLNAWYGDPDSRYRYSGRRFEALPWNEELSALRQLVEQECGVRFNSVLANLYRDGADSVAWHADDEPELGDNPIIASLSLGGTRKFQMKRKQERAFSRIDIELHDNSLLIMAGSLQHDWLHRIPKTRRPVAARINLTFRRIHPL